MVGTITYCPLAGDSELFVSGGLTVVVSLGRSTVHVAPRRGFKCEVYVKGRCGGFNLGLEMTIWNE